jgi:hypothetical protein
MQGMTSAGFMLFLLPAAAALVLVALVRMLVFHKFSMRVILVLVTGVAMLIPSLLSIR